MLAGVRQVARRDVAVAAGVGALELGVTTLASFHQHALHPQPRPLGPGGYLLLALGSVLLLWRTRYPAPVLLGVLGGTVAYALLNFPHGPIYLALIVAFATAVIEGHRAVAYASLIIGYPSLTLLAAAVTGQRRPSLPFLVGIAAWLLVLLVGAELIRIRHAFVRESRRRRLEAELAQEEERRRRASEERLEIARELHDLMAHSISLINVQAGVALELMGRQPDQARQALTVIKAASKDALVEVQSVLSALRGPGDPQPSRAPGRAPSLSPAALDELVERVRLAGVPVQVEVTGQPVALSADLDRAAARIVREALTNVARHAPGRPTRVRIDHPPGPAPADSSSAGPAPGALVIVVENDGPPVGAADPRGQDPRPGGRGIAGMRERAEAFGGTLTAGPRPDGGFRVHAQLPGRAAADRSAP